MSDLNYKEILLAVLKEDSARKFQITAISMLEDLIEKEKNAGDTKEFLDTITKNKYENLQKNYADLKKEYEITVAAKKVNEDKLNEEIQKLRDFLTANGYQYNLI